jgi:cytochrome c biogenesis protein CcdA
MVPAATNNGRGPQTSRRPGSGMIELVIVGVVAGFLAGISPCILPVLPVVLVAGAARPARAGSAEARPAKTEPARAGAAIGRSGRGQTETPAPTRHRL